MNYNLDLRLAYEPLRTAAFGSILATYTPVGSSTLTVGRILLIQNLTDQTLTFSLDGINDMLQLPAEGFLLLDLRTNDSYLAVGTTFYVKYSGVAPTLGSADISVFFAAGS